MQMVHGNGRGTVVEVPAKQTRPGFIVGNAVHARMSKKLRAHAAALIDQHHGPLPHDRVTAIELALPIVHHQGQETQNKQKNAVASETHNKKKRRRKETEGEDTSE